MHIARICSLSVVAMLCACGPQCPAANAVRDDLPATTATDGLAVTLKATRVGQANDSPGALFVKWSGAAEGAVQLTLTDADGTVLTHPSAQDEREGFHLIRLQNTQGSALPAGLYGITVSSGPKTVSARFEIVHCALYY